MKKKILENLPVVISYGAVLMLFSQTEKSFVIALLLLFIAGTVLIVRKKPVAGDMTSPERKRLIVAAAFATLSFGLFFYNRWVSSPGLNQFLQRKNLDIRVVLSVLSLLISGLAFHFVYNVLGSIKKLTDELPDRYVVPLHLITGFVASVMTVVLSQVMIFSSSMMMGFFRFLAGVLIVYAVFLLFYGLTNLARSSVIISTLIFMILATANTYVFQFRNRLLDPIDIFSAGTAMNVLDNYSLFPVPWVLLFSWLFYIGYIWLFCRISGRKAGLPVRIRIAVVAVGLVGSLLGTLYASGITRYNWADEGAVYNGFILNFVAGISKMGVDKPKDYSIRYIEDICVRYEQDPEDNDADQEKPHLIVIMDEAFSDLSLNGEIHTNIEVTPFISSLQENAISGCTLVSVFGGNTSSSEYEFLTGNSMAWLPVNSVPYTQYVRSPAYSMVSYLKSRYQYRCLAFHPFYADSWNRSVAYPYLGFDECFFLDSFPGKKTIRSFVSDQEMFEQIIQTYEKEHDVPLFLFGVSMQNHGGYNKSAYVKSQAVSLSGYSHSYPLTEQYLSLIHETDKAVEYLIRYFSEADDKVVIVFFGDHQPKIEEEFYGEVCGYNAGSLDEIQNRYKVPFFVWANYEIEEKHINCTSLNYLSSYMYEAAGLELPVYNRFLSDMEKVIPSVNANGFYSNRSARFLPFDAASGEERSWLEQYQILQYNNVFDKKNRNPALFPVLD